MLSVAFLSFPLAASALVLSPATSDAIVQPAVSQNLTKALGSLIGLSQSANSTSSSLHSPPVWSCDGARFGYLLNIYSCAEAVGVMFSGRDIDIQRSWFNRGTEGTGLPLPQRFMSSTGTCFSEPIIAPGKGNTAQASLNELRQGVKALMNNCVGDYQGHRPGGIATDFNADKKMGVLLVGNSPTARCYGPASTIIETSCHTILDSIQASDTPITFGPAGDTSSTAKLPYTKVSRDRRCALTIKSDGVGDTWSWYEAFTKGVELAAMCGRAGKRGTQRGLGDNRHLSMEMGPPEPGVSES